jgi:hypothetical protein
MENISLVHEIVRLIQDLGVDKYCAVPGKGLRRILTLLGKKF